MAGTLNLIVESNLKLINASLTAAVVFGRGQWAARQVRKWIRIFQKENRLPTNVYGTWNASVMEDEDFSAAIQNWLRERGKYVQARDVIDFFGTPAAARFSSLIDTPPSIRTAQRWMQWMGYTWMKERRGQFADGHEQDDVKDYRMNFYVPEWTKLERRMRSWDSEGKEVPPTLNEGERIVVVWFHDESTFYAHDRRLTRWVHENETAGIYKKGEGVSLMVADFISADYGWLRSRPVLTSATSNAPVGSATEAESSKENPYVLMSTHGNIGFWLSINWLCIDVASGLEYMHAHNMVHGDLKALNVLVSSDGIARLSDFDFSVMSEASGLMFTASSNSRSGSIRWVAPEMLAEDAPIRTKESDVYALGMTMLEIFTGSVPYPECERDFNVMKKVERGTLPNPPTEHLGTNQRGDVVWELMLSCWSRTLDERPSAGCVVEVLTSQMGLS
ncbi:tyrosine kinase catalytic domain protein, partial [Rhizoctonia solani AG-3 Rhs1AP]